MTTTAIAITAAETPAPIPAFAPVDRPGVFSSGSEGVVEVEVGIGGEDSVPVTVDIISVDCQAMPTGIACTKGME